VNLKRRHAQYTRKPLQDEAKSLAANKEPGKKLFGYQVNKQRISLHASRNSPQPSPILLHPLTPPSISTLRILNNKTITPTRTIAPILRTKRIIVPIAIFPVCLIRAHHRPKTVNEHRMMRPQSLAHMTPDTHQTRHKRTHNPKQGHHSHQCICALSSFGLLPVPTAWPDDITYFIDLPSGRKQPDSSEHEYHRLDDVQWVHAGIYVAGCGIGVKEPSSWVIVVVVVLIIDYSGPVPATNFDPVLCLLATVAGISSTSAACDVELAIRRVGWA